MPKTIKIISEDKEHIVTIPDNMYTKLLTCESINEIDNTILYPLIDNLLETNKWNAFNICNDFKNLLISNIVEHIGSDYEKYENAIKSLQYINDKNNLCNGFLKYTNFDLNLLIKKEFSFFKNNNLLSKIFNISNKTIGKGELLFTLFTKCYKGKVVDLFAIDKQIKEYKQIEIKGPDGRIGSQTQAREFIDAYKIQNNIPSDNKAIKKIINDLESLSINQKISIIYNMRTEYASIDENYFKTQLNTILTEFENIKYDKLLLATQIYSYCTYIGANYLILLNNMKALNIEINCLWGIYEQIIDQPIKINYSISNRYGFGVTYNPA